MEEMICDFVGFCCNMARSISVDRLKEFEREVVKSDLFRDEEIRESEHCYEVIS